MRKKIDKNVIMATMISISAGFLFEYFVRKALPVDSPYSWLGWLAVPLAFVLQRMLLKERNKR
jgi:predicted permease